MGGEPPPRLRTSLQKTAPRKEISRQLPQDLATPYHRDALSAPGKSRSTQPPRTFSTNTCTKGLTGPHSPGMTAPSPSSSAGSATSRAECSPWNSASGSKPSLVPGEMAAFLEWLKGPPETSKVLRAALAHLWFVTIHPFDGGNGCIARAIADMCLARADNTPQCYYSMSAPDPRRTRTALPDAGADPADRRTSDPVSRDLERERRLITVLSSKWRYGSEGQRSSPYSKCTESPARQPTASHEGRLRR